MAVKMHWKAFGKRKEKQRLTHWKTVRNAGTGSVAGTGRHWKAVKTQGNAVKTQGKAEKTQREASFNLEGSGEAPPDCAAASVLGRMAADAQEKAASLSLPLQHHEQKSAAFGRMERKGARKGSVSPDRVGLKEMHKPVYLPTFHLFSRAGRKVAARHL